MASRIKGITVEIGGDTTGLDKALKNVNATIRTTQSSLKDVNKLLKQYDMMQKMMKKVKCNPKAFMRGLGSMGGRGGFKGFGR